MSKKRRQVVERLPLWLSVSEAEYLLDLVQDKGDRLLLAHHLRQVRSRLLDDAERLKEIVARERANGFWEDLKTANAGLLQKLRKGQRLRKQHVRDGIETLAKEEIAAIPPEDMKALLEDEGRLRGKRGGHQQKRSPPGS